MSLIIEDKAVVEAKMSHDRFVQGELSTKLYVLLRLVVTNKKGFKPIAQFLAANRIYLLKSDKQKLQGILIHLIRDNTCIDSMLLSFISEIDFIQAHVLFLKQRKQRSCRTNKTPPKKQIKPYMAPIQPKVSAQEKIAQFAASPKVGLGVMSEVKIPRVKSTEVLIDKNTELKTPQDKSILYAAGWSLKNETDLE